MSPPISSEESLLNWETRNGDCDPNQQKKKMVSYSHIQFLYILRSCSLTPHTIAITTRPFHRQTLLLRRFESTTLLSFLFDQPTATSSIKVWTFYKYTHIHSTQRRMSSVKWEWMEREGAASQPAANNKRILAVRTSCCCCCCAKPHCCCFGSVLLIQFYKRIRVPGKCQELNASDRDLGGINNKAWRRNSGNLCE